MYKTVDYQNFYSPDFSFSSNANKRYSYRGPEHVSIVNPPTGLTSDSKMQIIPVEYETLKHKVDEIKVIPASIGTPTPSSNFVERFDFTETTKRILSVELILIIVLFFVDFAFGTLIRDLLPSIKYALIIITIFAIVYFATKK